MKNREIKQAIRQAFSNAAPDVLDCVLSDCREQKGTVIVMTQKKKSSRVWKAAAVAAALALIIGIGFGAGSYRLDHTVASTVSLDVNPSIEIRVNRNERVLEVDARNQDAEIVLDDMDLEGSDLNVAVNAIIGSMVRNGYLSELANSILVSVDSRDAETGAALQEKLTAEIGKLLDTAAFSGAVLSQTVTHETELENSAREYGITLGKAQLIARIMKLDSRYAFAELAELSINELNLIIEGAQTPVENVEVVGTPSDKGYIGRQAARDAALTHAGIGPEQVSHVEIELDYDDGVMVYEVEFEHEGWEYNYEIDAGTGAVVKHEKEPEAVIPPAEAPAPTEATVPAVTAEPSDGRIGEDAALAAALSHAGLTREQIAALEIELDEDDGIARYEIEFEAGGYDYQYEVHGETGSILESGKEKDD